MKWKTLLDLIYPRACVGCGRARPQTSSHLCWDCRADIHFIQPPYCAICGNPVPGHIDHDYVCSLCTTERPHYDCARASARHEGPLRKMLMAFKYESALWLAGDIVDLLEATVHTHFPVEDIDAVACVPLHGARKRSRGYNQAEILGRSIARRIGKPVLSRCVKRIRPTESQTHLTARQRTDNVKGAFATRWAHWIDTRRILLVDDVMTTGATASECALALKQGGARSVNVLTVVRR